MADVENTVEVKDEKKESYFDGKLIQLIGWSILAWLVTACTLCICLPWGLCMIMRWKTRHTVIEGKRLEFDGKGIQLFGNWIKWWLLTIITFTIYGWWVPIKVLKWVTKHTLYHA